MSCIASGFIEIVLAVCLLSFAIGCQHYVSQINCCYAPLIQCLVQHISNSQTSALEENKCRKQSYVTGLLRPSTSFRQFLAIDINDVFQAVLTLAESDWRWCFNLIISGLEIHKAETMGTRLSSLNPSLRRLLCRASGDTAFNLCQIEEALTAWSDQRTGISTLSLQNLTLAAQPIQDKLRNRHWRDEVLP